LRGNRGSGVTDTLFAFYLCITYL